MRLYVDIHMHLLGGQLSFDSLHVPRYPSSFDRGRSKFSCHRSCDRIPVPPVSRTGTIRPATGTREVFFCLAKIKPVKLTPERTDLTVLPLAS